MKFIAPLAAGMLLFQTSGAFGQSDADTYLYWGLQYQQQGDCAQAISYLEYGLSQKPGAKGWTQLAYCYETTQNLEKAREAYRKASELDPTDDYAAQRLAALSPVGEAPPAQTPFSQPASQEIPATQSPAKAKNTLPPLGKFSLFFRPGLWVDLGGEGKAQEDFYQMIIQSAYRVDESSISASQGSMSFEAGAEYFLSPAFSLGLSANIYPGGTFFGGSIEETYDPLGGQFITDKSSGSWDGFSIMAIDLRPMYYKRFNKMALFGGLLLGFHTVKMEVAGESTWEETGVWVGTYESSVSGSVSGSGFGYGFLTGLEWRLGRSARLSFETGLRLGGAHLSGTINQEETVTGNPSIFPDGRDSFEIVWAEFSDPSFGTIRTLFDKELVDAVPGWSSTPFKISALLVRLGFGYSF